jgi:hypothetical protein
MMKLQPEQGSLFWTVKNGIFSKKAKKKIQLNFSDYAKTKNRCGNSNFNYFRSWTNENLKSENYDDDNLLEFHTESFELEQEIYYTDEENDY